tara:strand:+ start:178 stop:630 length:453 start_codon:yes stop_codon:yes gene_type:complete
MNTKIITLLSLLSFVSNTNAKFGIPDNVNFVTQLYNTSNCSQQPFRNISLQYMCFKTNIVNGYPECCQDLFNDISVFDNTSLGKCIQTNMTFTNRTGVRYQCNMTHLKDLSLEETFSYIGIIFTILVAVSFVFTLGWCVCGGSRKSYERM